MNLFFLLPGGVEPLVLSISDSTPSGSASGANPTGLVTSNVTTVSVVSGGSGSYTYSWTINGSPSTNGPFQATAASAATTAFTDADVLFGGAQVENWICTVTDTGNGKVATIGCTVTLTWTDTT